MTGTVNVAFPGSAVESVAKLIGYGLIISGVVNGILWVIKRKESVVNNTFVKMLEALGYDIELHYVKRENG